jgi:heme-degrading monooxygenase HmoA
MIVRLTYFGFSPEKIADVKKFYFEEAVPTVKSQKGNLDCRLLEPVNKSDDYISMTVWDNQQDADAYHSGGVYKQLVGKVKQFFTKEATLKVYRSEGILEHV